MPAIISDFISLDRLKEVLARVPNIHIAVLGDFFLDKYLVIDPALEEVSIETGLNCHQIVDIRYSPGAAGTVTNNLSTLGVARITALGVIGDDGQGYELLQGLHATEVNSDGLIRTADRFTPTYTKPMIREAVGERELERLDIKNRRPLAPDIEERLIRSISSLLESRECPDAIIILDQVQERNCGVITDRVRDALAVLAISHSNVVFFADSRERIGEFRGMTVKPNLHEAAKALGVEVQEPANALIGVDIGLKLSERNGQTVYLTVGGDGIIVCGNGSARTVFAVPVKGPIDIVGAGDSATAGIVSALCCGATATEAAAIGNLCASITIRKLGTTGTASPDEILTANDSI